MKAEEIIPATHRLEQSGMNRNEAEAVVSELQKVVAPLATKDDLARLGQSIRFDMGTMEKSIRSDMGTKVDLAKMEARLFWRLSAIMLAVGGFVLSALLLVTAFLDEGQSKASVAFPVTKSLDEIEPGHPAYEDFAGAIARFDNQTAVAEHYSTELPDSAASIPLPNPWFPSGDAALTTWNCWESAK